MKPKILIIFPDEWVSHSPTVLNLSKALRRNFNVTVLAVNDGAFKNDDLRDEGFFFIRIPHWLACTFLRRVRPLYSLLKAALLLIHLSAYRKFRPVDEVIAVDSVGLWVAQKVFRKCHFLSLEVQRDLFFRMCKPACVQSVAIQTPERLSALSSLRMAPTFFIQNSPSLAGINIDQHRKTTFNRKLIYLGNILPSHGIFKILDAFDGSPWPDLELTIKGVLYKNSVRRTILQRYEHLFREGKIFLDESYTPQEKIVEHLARFSLGFCIYDFNLLKRDDFNYVSCPSGKLFNFYAAGVPVIGTDVLGLSSIRQFGTGILLPEISRESIRWGISRVMEDYSEFSRNCIQAAKHFDFDKASSRYAAFLTSSTMKEAKFIGAA